MWVVSFFQIFSKTVYKPIDSVPSPTTTDINAVSSSPPAMPDLSKYVAVDCEMVGVMDYRQRNAKGRPKMVSALGKSYVYLIDLQV